MFIFLLHSVLHLFCRIIFYDGVIMIATLLFFFKTNMVCFSVCPDILASLRLIFIFLIQFWVFYYLFYSFILL